MGGPGNGNFPFLFVVKMSLRRRVVQNSLKTPLRNIKMAPSVSLLYQNSMPLRMQWNSLETLSVCSKNVWGARVGFVCLLVLNILFY